MLLRLRGGAEREGDGRHQSQRAAPAQEALERVGEGLHARERQHEVLRPREVRVLGRADGAHAAEADAEAPDTFYGCVKC